VKIILLKNNLKTGLDVVGRAIGSNLNLPVLGSVLISAKNNRIKLSATNLELAVTKDIFGKVVEEGSMVIPYGILSSTVNNTTSEKIHLEKTKQGNLEFKTDNYTATIQSVGEKEFPILPDVKKDEAGMEVDLDALREALMRVVIAGEASDIRPEIGGVLFIGEANELKLAATDSFRLAEAIISGSQVKSKSKEPFTATVPIKTAQELTRIIDEEKVINIYFDNNQVLFETENISLISRLIEGKFPDYTSIIPKDVETKVFVKREELINALKLASSFVGRTNDVLISIKDKKILEVYSSDNARGENKYLISVKVEGPDTEAVFNWKYLLEGIRAGTSKEISIGLNGSDKPVLIKDPGDESHFYILMPIKPN